MRVNEQMRFPYPVLWAQTTDYANGEFAAILHFQENLNTGQLTLSYSMLLNEPSLQRLLEGRQAAVGLFVSCGETYYNTLLPISFPNGTLEISAGLLKGRVVIRPLMWAVEQITSFRSPNLHAEFGSGAVRFPKGGILALTDEIVIHVGREKLQNMGSIFALSVDDEVPPDQFRVQLEGENIKIVAARAACERMHALRGIANGRAVLLNAVYLPVLMEVLASLREEGELYEGKRWHRVFTARMDHLDIKVESEKYLENAQKLLKAPFGRITGLTT